jgi:hypothetical protein
VGQGDGFPIYNLYIYMAYNVRCEVLVKLACMCVLCTMCHSCRLAQSFVLLGTATSLYDLCYVLRYTFYLTTHITTSIWPFHMMAEEQDLLLFQSGSVQGAENVSLWVGGS